MFHLNHFSSPTCSVALCLNDNLWLYKWLFHSPSASPRYAFRQWSCYVAITNYVVNLTVPFHLTFWFFSAILFWYLVLWVRCDFFVMSLDYFWHIVPATIADFNCVAVEHFVKLVASSEMFCYKLNECLCNVCLNRFVKGWVKPYVSLSRLVFLICCWCISNQHYNTFL